MATEAAVGGSLEGLIQAALLGRAAEAARAGRYSEAERLLQGIPPTAASRDLLARVFAQQGKDWEAEEAWRETLKLRPEDSAARDGLARLAARRMGRGWMSQVKGLLAADVVQAV